MPASTPLQGKEVTTDTREGQDVGGHVGWNLAREVRLASSVTEHVTGHEGRSRVIIAV